MEDENTSFNKKVGKVDSEVGEVSSEKDYTIQGERGAGIVDRVDRFFPTSGVKRVVPLVVHSSSFPVPVVHVTAEPTTPVEISPATTVHAATEATPPEMVVPVSAHNTSLVEVNLNVVGLGPDAPEVGADENGSPGFEQH